MNMSSDFMCFFAFSGWRKELQTICKTFAIDGPAQFEAERCTLCLGDDHPTNRKVAIHSRTNIYRSF